MYIVYVMMINIDTDWKKGVWFSLNSLVEWLIQPLSTYMYHIGQMFLLKSVTNTTILHWNFI